MAINRFLPSLAVSTDASPLGWSQIWSHLRAGAANHSRIRPSKALQSLPWAQGVAGSNPVAPTTFRGSGVNTGVPHSATPGIILRCPTAAEVRRYNGRHAGHHSIAR
jgi:hypothetical protein